MLKEKRLKFLMTAFFAGFVFALGLGISGMTLPSKVIGFLDLTGDWDPSLAFVMIGAIIVHTIAWNVWLKKKSRPLLALHFSLPELKKIDKRLIFGAVLFGIGWGLAGFCPGPALVSLVSLHQGVLIFVLAMIAGMGIARFLPAPSSAAPRAE